jgi:uncharacterized protein
MRPLLLLTLWIASLAGGHLHGETLPPKPPLYFNDYANVVPAAQAKVFNEKLAQFERETSNQIVVAVYPKMESDSSIEDFTVRTFHSWGVGQKDKKNGAVLFVFVNDHKMYLNVGYGLEGVIPDITAKSIIRDVITPQFKQQDFAGGLRAGIDSILAATRGEYHGTGRTVREQQGNSFLPDGFWIFVVWILFVYWLMSKMGNNRSYSSSGFRSVYWNSGISSSSWSGSDSSSSGGFSGGGGDSGGGGAGGSW